MLAAPAALLLLLLLLLLRCSMDMHSSCCVRSDGIGTATPTASCSTPSYCCGAPGTVPAEQRELSTWPWKTDWALHMKSVTYINSRQHSFQLATRGLEVCGCVVFCMVILHSVLLGHHMISSAVSRSRAHHSRSSEHEP
jgi:hypothetical protein